MKPIDLIFDTDVGSDCDDMMALAYLVYAGRQGYVRLRAVTYSNGVPEGPATIRAMLRTLSEEVPPIGIPTTPMKPHDNYCKVITQRFAIDQDINEPNHNAVSLLRRTLTQSENAVVCAVGAMTNIAGLLQSEPDEISPLNGVELVRRACNRVILMAGIFEPDNPRTEWNIHLDIPAARTVATLCPVPLIWLPSETGISTITGAPVLKKFGDGTPLSLSFQLFPGVIKRGGRPSWDPLTTLYAIEGCKDIFVESAPGTVTVREDGKTTFTPDTTGHHLVLTLRDDDTPRRAAAYLDQCALAVHHSFLANN